MRPNNPDNIVLFALLVRKTLITDIHLLVRRKAEPI